MKFFLIDPAGLGLDVALLAKSQGHEVRHFIRDTPATRRIGEGTGIQRVREISPHHRWADVVMVTDNSNYISVRDAARQDTKAFWIGADAVAVALENDRKFGMEIMQRYDIPVAPYEEFHDFDAAIEYVSKRDDRFVCKPCGEDRKDLTYVSKGPEDMLYMLNRWKKMGTMKCSFILQDFIDGVAEFGAEGWFTGEGWAPGWHESFEHKKLMNDEVGVNTGEMGTVNFVTRKSAIADKVLVPITEYLRAIKYTGFLSLNCIVDKKGGIWPLEFTSRCGWPCVNLQVSLNDGDFVENLYHNHAPSFKMNTVCTGVVMAIPDFPYSRLTRKEVTGVPVWGFDGESLHHHPCEMMQDKDGQWQTAGDYVCVVTGHGTTVTQASKNAYLRLKKLTLPNSPMYRTDIGRKLEKALPALHKVGLAQGIKY